MTHNSDLLFVFVLNDKTLIFESKTIINLKTFTTGLKNNKALSGIFIWREKTFISAIKNKLMLCCAINLWSIILLCLYTNTYT